MFSTLEPDLDNASVGTYSLIDVILPLGVVRAVFVYNSESGSRRACLHALSAIRRAFHHEQRRAKAQSCEWGGCESFEEAKQPVIHSVKDKVGQPKSMLACIVGYPTSVPVAAKGARLRTLCFTRSPRQTLSI